ncbi:unnamed protein product, partial [Staurois parvus]
FNKTFASLFWWYGPAPDLIKSLVASFGSFTVMCYRFRSFLIVPRGGLTIWKLGHCPRARGQ